MSVGADQLTRNDQECSSAGKRPAYIVIVSPSYGGAEKRFFDIFRRLRAQNENVYLIAPSSLAQRLVDDHTDGPAIANGVISVQLDSWRPIRFMQEYRQVLARLPRGASFHYPLNCLWPLHLGRQDRITLSVADCINTPGVMLLNRAALWTWLSFFMVEQIDVLSPAIFRNMKGYRMARKMSLTPGGTFIETPSPPSSIVREPIVLLMSRLVSLKGIDDLLDVLPEVWRRIGDRAQKNLVFKIAGYGPLEEHIGKRIIALTNAGVPSEFIGYADATLLFPSVAVALSVQEITNYPSRVVAEALTAGSSVIVRDTGDSRQFGELPGLLYCAEQLDAVELADKIVTLINAVTSNPAMCDEIKEAALKRFGGRDSIEYFHGVLGFAQQ